jgi:hypothetical protein
VEQELKRLEREEKLYGKDLEPLGKDDDDESTGD